MNPVGSAPTLPCLGCCFAVSTRPVKAVAGTSGPPPSRSSSMASPLALRLTPDLEGGEAEEKDVADGAGGAGWGDAAQLGPLAQSAVSGAGADALWAKLLWVVEVEILGCEFREENKPSACVCVCVCVCVCAIEWATLVLVCR